MNSIACHFGRNWAEAGAGKQKPAFWVASTLLAALFAASSASADTLELLNGQRIEGEVARSTPQAIVMKITVGGRSVEMPFVLDKVHAVTIGGQRRVVNEKTAAKPARPEPPKTAETGENGEEPEEEAGPRANASDTEEGGSSKEKPGVKEESKPKDQRTRSEIMAMIDKAGKTTPDWWDSATLDYPQTLDLTWEKPPKGQWITDRYLGPYIISVITPNPGKWKDGAKLLHHTLTVNKDDRERLGASMERLGYVYGKLLGDYARAAFWWQKAANYGANVNALFLAEAYFKLGSKDMAAQVLSRLGDDNTGVGNLIKMWSDIGDLRKALALAERKADAGRPDVAYRAAGDACRSHGRYKEALAFYQKVLEVPTPGGNEAKQVEKNKERARHNTEAIKVYEALNLAQVPDGDYEGTATGFRGPLTVRVKVKKAKIEEVKIAQHKEDWFFTSFTEVPKQIIEKQGVKGVDAVTGATMTSEAIINATAKALATGMK